MRTIDFGSPDSFPEQESNTASSRFVLQAFGFTIFFVASAMLWAHPEAPGAKQGVEALAVILMLLVLAATGQANDVVLDRSMSWWKEKLLAICLACGFSALILDFLAWSEARGLMEQSHSAKLSLLITGVAASASCLLLIAAGVVSSEKHPLIKRWTLNFGVLFSVIAVFSEIGLVMAVREPVLPHSVAIYERFATFFLVVAVGIFMAYKVGFSLTRSED